MSALRWNQRLRMPLADGGATICEKHDFIDAHYQDPDMAYEVHEALMQAKDDGQRMERRLQELGEEANNLEAVLTDVESERDQLRAEVERLRKESVRWIPVEERLPEDGARVGFITRCARDPFYHGRVLGGRYTAGEFGGFSVPGLTTEASHWFPFPDLPAPTSHVDPLSPRDADAVQSAEAQEIEDALNNPNEGEKE